MMKHVEEDRLLEVDALIDACGYRYDAESRKLAAKNGSREWGRAGFVGVVPGITRGELTAYMAWKALRKDEN
jgi:hypothetical protein